MTKNTVKRADITLPLLIEYVDALLPSLTTQTELSPEHSKDNSEALWVAHNNADLLALQAQLDDTTSTNENTEARLNAQKLSTLSDLAKQHVPDRYELACFWLPTLSEELTQHYVPLLMRYRDLYAAHLLIALDSSIDLKPYGFTPFDILSEPSLNIDDIQSITSSTVTATLWQFNLYDYKQLPNWLNADYWANPENWGKHRW
ncbi:DUF6231 family protein [Psychrobacter sp. JCM 18900]|uniref:DUF6231 family protein n=1 Tax=Psychrobacter sp. JCM 18900 TaxID=1298608 RepID=UPI00191ACB59|nr:DUF6231 family protein [Psychrobacter sp. JCM 18900]